MFRSLVVAGCSAVELLCGGCATTTTDEATVADSPSKKVYRTGSNIAVRDYDSTEVTVIDAETLQRRIPESPARPRIGGAGAQ
jgi:hypothetical protein